MMNPYDYDDAEAFEQTALDFDSDIDWGDELELACGVEDPDVCDSCQ